VTTDQPEALKPSSQGQCKARQGKARQGRQAQEISTRLSSTASDPAVSPEAAQRNTAQSLTCAWRRETRRDETRARYSLHGHPTVRTVFLVPVAHCRHRCDIGVELRPASLLAVAPIMAESRRPQDGLRSILFNRPALIAGSKNRSTNSSIRLRHRYPPCRSRGRESLDTASCLDPGAQTPSSDNVSLVTTAGGRRKGEVFGAPTPDGAKTGWSQLKGRGKPPRRARDLCH
jgi:hypothetical protein